MKEIEINRELRREYGLTKRKEVMIASSFLKKYKNLAKKLIAATNEQSKKEKVQIMDKLQRLGLIVAGAELDNILDLELKDILERRIQSVVFRKGLARTIKQARQFITHRHIRIGDQEITVPGYIISLEEESNLQFKSSSGLSDEEHPERVNLAKEIHKEAESVKPIGNSEESASKETGELSEAVVKETKSSHSVRDIPSGMKEEKTKDETEEETEEVVVEDVDAPLEDSEE
jgi:small subunit ribosomal protein S4